MLEKKEIAESCGQALCHKLCQVLLTHNCALTHSAFQFILPMRARMIIAQKIRRSFSLYLGWGQTPSVWIPELGMTWPLWITIASSQAQSPPAMPTFSQLLLDGRAVPNAIPSTSNSPSESNLPSLWTRTPEVHKTAFALYSFPRSSESKHDLNICGSPLCIQILLS